MSDHNNGHRRGGPAIPFPAGVPIIGQPFTLKNFFVTVQIVCNCEAKEPVLLVGNSISQCPGCRRAFQMQEIQANPGGGLQFMIGLVAQQPAADAAPENAS